MKTWIILHNTKKETYSLSDKESLKIHKQYHDDEILIKELEEDITHEEAYKIYLDFLDLIFPGKY